MQLPINIKRVGDLTVAKPMMFAANFGKNKQPKKF